MTAAEFLQATEDEVTDEKPNKALHLTAYSVRSFVAPASSSR